MSKTKAQVVSIAAEREAQEAKKAFLGLLHADISDNPERIEPIPASLLSRMDSLRAKAQANRERSELLEG
ncbi:hypothetical protein [Pseudomonas putida]|uniref:Uncharacterized protein n=1 Tax=Pseudomonas putida TaxID=303 RepID=A0A6S5U361_PSEPU|nr:hypothetical protein [Pseudomonas putida]BBT40999.1 hypothetical protein WP8W18C01_33400 [Pseudomonas putida]